MSCLFSICRYIVSFLLDSTIGLVVIYIGLQISQCIAKRKGWDSLMLGEYGEWWAQFLMKSVSTVW